MKIIKTVSMSLLSLGLACSIGFSSAYAQTPRVDFIDVSHYNNEQGLPLSFYQTIKNAGVKGVVCKVSEGSYSVDPAASVNITNARQAGLVVSAYHFARYKSIDGAQKEAQWFDKKLQLVGFDPQKDGYVVVDIEDNSLSSNPSTLTVYTNAFINEMKRLGYPRVDLYSGSYYYNSRLQPSKLPPSPWLASYPYTPDINNVTAKFTNGYGAWQWSSTYTFTGMSNFGRFDVSQDFAGKYTNGVVSTPPVVISNSNGNISLVNYLASKGKDFSFNARAKLAAQYGIANYTGTAAQNLALLAKLESNQEPSNMNFENSKLNTDQPKARPVDTNVIKSSTYKVQYGDSLSKIASKLGTTVNTLVKLNNITNKNFIKVGQVLKVNGTVSNTSSNVSTGTYTVRSGDNLSEIAHKFDTSVIKLASINGIKNVNVLYIGQVLKINSTVKATSTTAIYHKVINDDTVSELAKRYDSSTNQIKNWNNLNSHYTIFVGKTIRVR